MILQHALRSLCRAPGYALTVIMTLALGLASVGSMFAVLYGVLLAPLPFHQPERLVSIQLELADGTRLNHSPALHLTYQQFATQLEDLALYRTGGANLWSGSEDVGAENIQAAWITPSALRLLRTPPLLGRGFSADEGLRGGPEAVILSEFEWHSRFAASADAIGRTLIVNNVPRVVVGVMPASFSFPDRGVRLWMPVKLADSATAGDFLYAAIARLDPDATLAGAMHELNRLLPRMAELFPQLQSGGSTGAWIDDAQPVVRLAPLHEVISRDIAPTLWMLASVAGLVLFVAWANVANLVLVRIDAGRQQVAIRRALGASALRASAPLLGEACVLGLAAAVLALTATFAALLALKAYGPADLPRLNEVVLEPWMGALIVLIALPGSVLGTAALARIGAATVLPGLHGGTRGQSSGRSQQRLRAAVSVLQIGAALVVLAGSAMLLRTAHRLNATHPGFEADTVTTFRVLLPYARFGESERVAFHARLIEEVAQLPTVQAAGLVATLPLGRGSLPVQMFHTEDTAAGWSLPVNVASSGYFAAMRIPRIAGRDFAALDSQRPDELIISQRAARTLYTAGGGAEVLGKTLRLEPGGPTYTIIGVVGNVAQEDLSAPPPPMVYRAQVVAAAPTDPGPLPSMVLTVRSAGPADALVAAVRRVVRDLDASVPIFEVSSMREVVRQSMARLTLTLEVMAAAGAVSLALGMLGLYGLMAYTVSLRQREFGVRLALGADPRRILRSVLARGLALSAIGVSAGLIVYSLAAPVLRASIAGVEIWDPWSLLSAIGLLLGMSVLACWLPALRAAEVAPARALRVE